MKPPDSVLRELVFQWLGKADIDYRTAQRLVSDPDPIRESIAFHCQQAFDDVMILTPFGVNIRYPGDFPEVLPGQEIAFFELARRAREAILAQLDRHP